MSSADELLEQARKCFWLNRKQNRDALLECGRKLHAFVLAFLEEGNGKGEYYRYKRGINRKEAIRRAADALRNTPARICKIIAGAMVVDLFAKDTGVGDLTHDAIVCFTRFIRRGVTDRQTFRTTQCRNVPGVETWGVKPEYEEAARKLWARTVHENTGNLELRVAVIALFRGRPTLENLSPEEAGARPARKARVVQDQGPAAPRLATIAPVASAGDLAESLFEIVRKAEDPLAVAERLLSMVRQEVKGRARKHSFAS